MLLFTYLRRCKGFHLGTYVISQSLTLLSETCYLFCNWCWSRPLCFSLFQTSRRTVSWGAARKTAREKLEGRGVEEKALSPSSPRRFFFMITRRSSRISRFSCFSPTNRTPGTDYLFLILRWWQTRTQCCEYIVAETNVSLFALARNICCGHKICVRDTKSVSPLISFKHFLSASNVFPFASPKKTSFATMSPPQCVLVCHRHHTRVMGSWSYGYRSFSV